MAIPANLSDVPDVNPYIQYVSGSGQTVFPYPFPITQDSDLVVVVGGVAQPTDGGYSLSGVGNDTGGNVTFTSGQTSGTIITLYRDIPIERLTQFSQNGGFSSSAFNAEFNNLYLIAQQIEAQFTQALRVPSTNNPAPTTVLTPALYANKYLAFDANGNPTPAVLTSSGSVTQSLIAGLLYPATPAENSAGVVPVNLAVPHHLAIGCVLPERYGGAGDNSTVNDTAHANALKVANAMGDGVVVYGGGGAGIWKFAAPITIGAAGQGRRVVGYGRPEFSFSGGIANTLDLITISANLFSLYQDQPQFEDIQVNCNSGGRDGVVLTVGNRPLIRNIRIDSPGRDGYVESTTAPNWIEKADVSVLVRSAGRNGFRQEVLGTAGANPFINEGNYFFEVRGVSVITAGGCALRMTGAAGLGGAAKLSDNTYRTVFDAIYNTAANVPATSPVISDTIVVQNPVFNSPAWENTGSGGNPGAGPLIKVQSGSWGGVTLNAPNWNSFWGDGTIDAAITLVTRLNDFSFPQNNQIVGPQVIKSFADGHTVLTLLGQTTTSTQPDHAITRTGAGVDALAQGAGIQLGNSTDGNFIMLQDYKGALVMRSFVNGAWNERYRVSTDAAGNVNFKLAGGLSFYQGTGGVLSNTVGANGDIYFRADGGSMTTIYQRRSGTWTGIV